MTKSVSSESRDSINVLIIDDRTRLFNYCNMHLSDGFNYTLVHSGKDGLREISKHDVVLLDKSFDTSPEKDLIGKYEDREFEGLTILKHLRKKNKSVPIIMVTSYPEYESLSQAFEFGVYDYMEWEALNIDPKFLKIRIQRAVRFRKETRQEWIDLFNGFGIVGTSEVMLKLYEQVLLVADSDSPVLLTGESGTGKTAIAKIIHQLSSRRSKPFFERNLSSFPKDIVRSELFGIEKGIASNVPKREGLFKKANQGTLFLDEIVDIQSDIQDLLLRTVEEGLIEPIGGTSEKVDTRIIAATNKNIEEEIETNRFRKDLYFRLSQYEIRLPSLKEHPEDIPDIANYFKDCFSRELNKEIRYITDEAISYLKNKIYSKNVRGPRDIIKKACKMSDGIIDLGIIYRADNKQGNDIPKKNSVDKTDLSRMTMEEITRQALSSTLKRVGGDKKEAAVSLGMSIAWIYEQVKRHNL